MVCFDRPGFVRVRLKLEEFEQMVRVRTDLGISGLGFGGQGAGLRALAGRARAPGSYKGLRELSISCRFYLVASRRLHFEDGQSLHKLLHVNTSGAPCVEYFESCLLDVIAWGQ